MYYFIILSEILGIVMIVSGLVVFIFPKAWNDFVLQCAYPEKRPGWYWPLGLAVLALVVYTWYRYFLIYSPYALIVSFFLSLGIAKVTMILFQYTRFRHLVAIIVLEERPALYVIVLSSIAIGICFVIMGILMNP